MSGISPGHNKFHTCQGCPDRSIDPNCHNECEGYKYRAKRIRIANDLERHEHRALDTTYGFDIMRRRYGK